PAKPKKVKDVDDFARFMGDDALSAIEAHTKPLRGGRAAENVEIAEVAPSLPEQSSANSTNSAAPPSREPVWPEDSVLQDYMDFARSYSESEDTILIGSVLAVVAAVLRRNVF